MDEAARLLEGARRGDREALGRLLERFAPAIRRFSGKMCQNPADADDVLQETLWAAARGISGFRGESSLSTWLFGIARSACLKLRRRSKFAPPVLGSLDDGEASRLPSDVDDPAASAETRELATSLDRALRTLGLEQREVLLLRDVEGLSASEVADIVETSVEAVKSKLHRARKELRAALESSAAGAPLPPLEPSCPDVVSLFSRFVEGDIDAETCRAMQDHVASCSGCNAACKSLERAVELCRHDGAEPVEPAVQTAIQTALRRALRTG